MHGIGTAALDCGDDRVGSQVALSRGRAAQSEGLVREPHVHGAAVLVGVDSRGGNAHLPAGSDHSDGYLTPVGYEHL